ncbi:ABC transporter ATP-binding protein [Thalassotalea aquiviva]|uniref:ABC transporter ATP-binding protein n=1 Tax=Thalassotalea aquiviva TaxID=3242415 RepID=UPI00352B3FE0
MTSPLLSCQHLNWQVADKQILNNVNFALFRGETVAIVGPNGAGKTSLLKCLYGEGLYNHGNVALHNIPIKQLSRKQMAKSIAVVDQHHASVFELTVFDVVRMGLTPHKGFFENDTDADRTTIQSALSQVGLAKQQAQNFNTLSGGEQQRALIARAIVQSAEILILDEPTNHLDMYYQHQVLKLAKSLNITLLFTIHDLNLAAEYSDRVVLMNHGKIVADGQPEQVFTPDILTSVFHLPALVDLNPFSKKLRITFAASPLPQKSGGENA